MNVIRPLGNAETGTTAATFLAQFEARRDAFGDDATARADAASWLQRHGLPRRTEEAWKYTSLRPLWETVFEPATTDDALAARLLADVLAAAGLDVDGDSALPRLVFVNGTLSVGLSRPPAGLGCGAFEGAAAGAPVRHPMVALNTMLAEDGAAIRVPAAVDGGRLLLVTLGVGTIAPTAFHLHHRVVLEQDARLSLLEIAGGEGIYLHDTLFDFELGAGSHARHVRLQQDAPGAFSFSLVQAAVATRAAYDGFNLALGAALARHEVHASLNGPHAAVHVNGAQLLGNTQVADLTSVISHLAPDCISRQTVKNVLTNRARGVFQGKIFVDRVAQKTDGYQMNQALLLSDQAEIDAKPELEIYADDVKCSHGATAGALDEEQLFYMRSRGVPDAEARAILVRAFLDDALALVEDEMIRAVLDGAVERWWIGRPA
ncbi:Fe-S cluster assembly protein SufD [Lichenicola sp.]|uniref:Fe-S cluster assembly protein SufD n=1 Tax=Lichenicola sp. TaxID=2804529 RepID=UPI003AFF93D2